MYRVIQGYCENGSKHGLFLMDMPTGFGKTYSVLKYIFDSCLKEENKNQLYFFITPLKKNLPIREIEQFFQESEKIKEFQQKFLFVNSNHECAIENFTDELREEIPSKIKETEEFQRFEQEISFLQKHSHDVDSSFDVVAKNTRENFRRYTEPMFRTMIQERLLECSDVERRLSLVKNDKEWQWLGKLYPAVFTRERQIFFMSMDKFLYKNSPIIEPSYYFYNSELIDNSIIFIDEFDSTKEKVLDYIIQNGLQGRSDPLSLFKTIVSALQVNEFPKVLTDFPSGKKKLHSIKKKGEKLFQTYQLRFLFHTIPDMKELYQNFLFQDYQFHSFLNANNSYVTFETDNNAKINFIHFTQENQKLENVYVYSMLGEIQKFIHSFQNMVDTFARDYRSKRKELTKEDSIRSVLDLFQLNKEDVIYLTNQILNCQQSSPILKVDFDPSIYENGFCYYYFENAPYHDMRTQIQMCSFQDSPEKWLIHVCERAKVIGISATATLSTVIGNFDLEYIQSKLQGTYVTLSDEDYQRLLQSFRDSHTGYQSRIKIHTELFGVDKYSPKVWLDILGDNDLANEIYNKLEMKTVSEKGSHYYHERYVRIAKAFKAFLQHDDIQSMLCFLTAHPKENNDKLDVSLLKEIFTYIAENFDFDVEKDFIILRTENYEKHKQNLTERLSHNEKIFVISTYQTVGAGQNLQYPIPSDLKGKLIHSNNTPPRTEKDFDAVYLDKPTNLFVARESDWKEEDFVKYLFEIQFLQENSEISDKDALEYIRLAFHCYATKEMKYPNAENVYSTKSVMMYATGKIQQAIGRICRTNQKRENIYIFADDRIADCIDLSIVRGRILNYEFLSLVEKIQALQSQEPIDKNLTNKGVLASNRACCMIDGLLQSDWTQQTITAWGKLRQFVLQHPTSSKEEAKFSPIYRNYVQLPEKGNILYYAQDEDFHEIQISFTKTKTISSVLDAEHTRLLRLMKWQPLKEYFISHRYATDFQPNDYILSPPLWNNIYKGALGEVVGRFFFEYVLEISLKEITSEQEFELFDFVTKDRKIYVDFKNWSEYTERDLNEEVEKIVQKAKKCKDKNVIIANILTNGSYQIRNFQTKGINFLIVPSLLNDKTIITVNGSAIEEIRRFIHASTN